MAQPQGMTEQWELEAAQVVGRLQTLHDTMTEMAGNDMGHLSYAEAALFHIATETIERLLDSIYDRTNKEDGV